MRTLVTGASGALGAFLSLSLLMDGQEVVSIEHDTKPMDSAKALGIKDQITWCHGDLLDGDFVKRVLADYEVNSVYHLAALPIVRVGVRTTIPIFQVNLLGTLNVLEALKEQKFSGFDIPFVFLATDKVYGPTNWGRKYLETDPLNANAPYEASKAMADMAVRTYKSMDYIKRASIVRACNIYGPGDMNSRIIPNTIRRCLKKEAPQVYNGVTYVREYMFISDFAEGMMKAMKYTFETGGDVFNIGSGDTLDQLEVIDEILQHFPMLKAEVVEAPPYTRNEIPYQALDSTKARQALGWKSDTTIGDGIWETVNWWEQHPELRK